jgi:hypothetical protein
VLLSTTGLLDSLYKERCGKQIARLTQYFSPVGTTGLVVLTVWPAWQQETARLVSPLSSPFFCFARFVFASASALRLREHLRKVESGGDHRNRVDPLDYGHGARMKTLSFPLQQVPERD